MKTYTQDAVDAINHCNKIGMDMMRERIQELELVIQEFIDESPLPDFSSVSVFKKKFKQLLNQRKNNSKHGQLKPIQRFWVGIISTGQK